MMKNVLFLFTLLCLSAFVTAEAQRNCGAMDNLDYRRSVDPGLDARMANIEAFTNQFISQQYESRDNTGGQRAVVTIPVVFHVVYRTSSENISDAQIQSQLQVLNDDFRRLNSDADNTWAQAADTEIEFCLASVDPNGNATNGITRTSTSVSSFGTNDAVKFSSSGGKDAWPASDYLNFWVCNIGGGILGYAQFPGGSAATDGVVCDYRYTGTIGTATAPFDLGRTATHEVGHWLNLRHIWGDGGCSVDDFVNDTPLSDGPNYGCNTGHVSCSSLDMVQNYMDYSDDACMNLYTAGQKTRMQALFAPGGFRVSLLSSNGCGQGTTPTCTDGIQNGTETGVDCGGSCPPCVCNGTEVTVTINLDNYPEETSWVITNSSGSTVASGGTYGSQPDGSTVTETICLPDDCYDFTINDSYGDGICCGYGNGSYAVTDENSNTLASGGAFGSSETTNFCLSSGPCPDSDGDGVCDADDQCPGTDDALIGTSCDDGDACTTNDVYNSNCNCEGTLIDADGDGVCDANDQCPGLNDALIGTACDDGDACTTGETYDNNCNCSGGVFQDSDGDGVCDANDQCPGFDDAIDANGNGIPDDCEGNCSYQTINFANFESGWGIWNDGGSDCRRSSNDNAYAIGTYCVRLRDNTSSSVMTTDNLNLSGYDELTVDFTYYPRSMDNSSEDFWLQISTNGGASYSTVEEWNLGDEFQNNNRYYDAVVIAGPFSSSTRLRFRCDASANGDWVYIDEVLITGCVNAAKTTPLVDQFPAYAPSKVEIVDGLTLYPNPTKNVLNVEFYLLQSTSTSIFITNMAGKIIEIATDKLDSGLQQLNVSTSELPAGVYNLHIVTGESTSTRRFVVVK